MRMAFTSNPSLSRNLQSSSSAIPLPSSRALRDDLPILHSISTGFRISAAFLAMAMATAAAMASTAVHSPSQLQKATVARTSAACSALSSRTSVAFSGFNATVLRANSTMGRSAGSNSSRLSVKAALEVDVSKIVPQADRVLIRLETLAAQSAGGVLLPSAAVKYDRYLQGEIIAAGSEVTEVEKGQKVMFSDVNAYEVNLGTSDRLCFCRSGDLLAIVQ